MFQVAPLPLTERALNKFGELFTQYLKEAIQTQQYPYGNPQRDVSDKVASGRLLNSIKHSVEIDTNGDPLLVIEYIDYFENVNLGRRAKKKRVPVNAILDWIRIRGITAQNNNGIPIPPLSLAFAIQQNIFKYGIRPTKIYDEGLDGLLNFVDNPPPGLGDEWQDVFDMIAEDVNQFLDKTITIELPSNIE